MCCKHFILCLLFCGVRFKQSRFNCWCKYVQNATRLHFWAIPCCMNFVSPGLFSEPADCHRSPYNSNSKYFGFNQYGTNRAGNQVDFFRQTIYKWKGNVKIEFSTGREIDPSLKRLVSLVCNCTMLIFTQSDAKRVFSFVQVHCHCLDITLQRTNLTLHFLYSIDGLSEGTRSLVLYELSSGR